MSVYIIGNPCQGICKIHPGYKICRGCYRTQLEITMWPRAKPEVKLMILDNTNTREKLYGNIRDAN